MMRVATSVITSVKGWMKLQSQYNFTVCTTNFQAC